MLRNSLSRRCIAADNIIIGAASDPELKTAFVEWYENAAAETPDGVPMDTIARALVVLQRLKDAPSLQGNASSAPGRAQISGAGGAGVKSILAAFGETRPFASESGRANRGLRRRIESLLAILERFGVSSMPADVRVRQLSALQEYLAARVREFHNRKRLAFLFDPAKTTRELISELLRSARETGREDAAAQYLVGAKLQLRYPDTFASNEPYSADDAQVGRAGPFRIGDTLFYVSVAPALAVYDACMEKIRPGVWVFLLVPERALEGASRTAEQIAPRQLAVTSIERFVSLNLEDLAVFRTDAFRQQLRRLLHTYNERVDRFDPDKSMMIDIPANL